MAAVSLAALSGLACGSSGESGGGAQNCGALAGYHATATTSSFATDVYPILSNTAAAHFGCGEALICHGEPAMAIDMSGATLKFTDPPATVYAALMKNSINNPSMKRVTPGDLTNSFLAYKVSDRATIACLADKCVPTVSPTKCGDPMPSIGMIDPADRTKILDWIALGAKP